MISSVFRLSPSCWPRLPKEGVGFQLQLLSSEMFKLTWKDALLSSSQLWSVHPRMQSTNEIVSLYLYSYASSWIWWPWDTFWWQWHEEHLPDSGSVCLKVLLSGPGSVCWLKSVGAVGWPFTAWPGPLRPASRGRIQCPSQPQGPGQQTEFWK